MSDEMREDKLLPPIAYDSNQCHHHWHTRPNLSACTRGVVLEDYCCKCGQTR